jgi:glycerol kinase
MGASTHLLGIDQGSSGSRAAVMDRHGRMLGYGYRPLPQLLPQTGWVEQDPHVLAQGVSEAITEALSTANCAPTDIMACGMACQRNTDFVWDADTNQPVANAISWQDLRTEPMLAELEQWSQAGERRQRLGYFPGTYSSALHLSWRLRHDPAVIAAAQSGCLRLGFSGNWLLTALGKPNGYKMDYSLVQQMGLYDFRAGQYWSAWLDILNIPAEVLPDIVPTVHHYGDIRIVGPNGDDAWVPVLAMIGNEQAALFGHQCYHRGDAECSHGTASFVDVVAGNSAPEHRKLNVYHAWSFPGDQCDQPEHTYCLEADTTVSGAALRWMRDHLGLFDAFDQVDSLAASVPSSGGVVFVPAFTGLNVPYNDPTARATILGMTLGSDRAHLVRAFLESLGYQIRGILDTIADETGLTVERISTGGGIAASDVACQIQADLTGIPTIRPSFTELAARAATLLAGIGAGTWTDLDALPPLPGKSTVFEPAVSVDQRDAGYDQWQRAVEKARGWVGSDR